MNRTKRIHRPPLQTVWNYKVSEKKTRKKERKNKRAKGNLKYKFVDPQRQACECSCVSVHTYSAAVYNAVHRVCRVYAMLRRNVRQPYGYETKRHSTRTERLSVYWSNSIIVFGMRILRYIYIQKTECEYEIDSWSEQDNNRLEFLSLSLSLVR